MKIVISSLVELAQLISVLNIDDLEAASGVPLRLMSTANLGAEAAWGDDRQAENLARIVKNASIGPEAILKATTAYDAGIDHGAADHLVGLHPTLGAPVKPDPDQVELANAGGTVTPDPDPAPTAAVDSNNLPHDSRIHSTPPKTNADGSWRARRGVDAHTVTEVTAELRAAQDAATATYGVTSETHALPITITDQTDIIEETIELVADGGGPDLTLLVESAQEAAGDASDSIMELIKVAKAFITDHGTAAFEAVKQAAAPGSTGMPAMTPGERRLLRACLDSYDLFV